MTALAEEKRAKPAFEVGQKMPDGSVFVGLTNDGKQQIFAMPKDLDVTLIFNDAAKAVNKLNADKNANLGHDDWQIPSLENLCVLYKNKNEGALKGTFKTASSSRFGCPAWYWSSTENRNFPSLVHIVRFSDGYDYWSHKYDLRLSCRPVRLEPVR